MSKIIDGREVASKLKDRIKNEVNDLKAKGITPGLAVIIVGEDPASKVYVANKKKDCEQVGILSEEFALPFETKQQELLDLIESLNLRVDIHGILVQLPLPEHIDEKVIINSINPSKDVDAFHPVNVGKIMIGEYNFLPCTPAGVIALLDDAGIEISGKNCVVIGRSNIVGKPMAMLLLHKNGTVTICHSKTKNLSEITKKADIIVVAIGKANFLKAEMIKDGAVIIDVGINRDSGGKLVGDVDFDSIRDKSGYITPVPGGVGPMTRTILLENTLKAAKLCCSQI